MNLTPEQIKEELEKIKDPYYCYKTYWMLPNGKYPILTKEEFEERVQSSTKEFIKNYRV